MKRATSIFMILGALLFPMGGLLAQEAKSDGAADSAAAESETGAGALKAGDFTFRFEKPWTEKAEPRAMSTGGLTFTPEGEGLTAVDADFYHFGAGQGGGVEPNIRRWQGQFVPGDESPKVTREEVKHGDLTVTIVRITGTFLDGPMFGKKEEKSGHALLGAIIPSEGGDVFIKMTGPEKSIDAAGDAFRRLIASAFGDE